MSKKIEHLIRKLGEEIYHLVDEGDKVADVVEEIRKEGYNLIIALNATVRLNAIEGFAPSEPALPPLRDPTPLVSEDGNIAPGTFTAPDNTLLKDLRISLDPPSG
jgi:hypothetical protein